MSSPQGTPRLVHVTFDRLPGWVERYDERHPGTRWTVDGDRALADSPDGASASIASRFGAAEQPGLDGFLAHLAKPRELGVVLVRKGGYAVAHVVGREVVDRKVGRRHVQGKTKAGGWSQQRFARRRDNQAREAYEAAAGHTLRILVPVAGRLAELAVGGDRAGVQAVLEDRRLAVLAELTQRWIGAVADPKRDVLDAAVEQARSVEIAVSDPLPR